MNERISRGEARRIALAAQGFDRARRVETVEGRHIRRTIDALGLVQIDSVNVLVRSHYLPLFSRLGAYDCGLVDRAAYAGKRRSLFEYWGHEASLLPVDLQPLLRWRMARAERGEGIYGGLARFARERADYIAAILAELAARGPLSAGELAEGGRGRGSWWGWSDGKHALEWLFWTGQVTTQTRRGFERVYDLPERCLPERVLAAPTPDGAEAQRRLLLIAARALGVASERDLRDYFRLDVTEARVRLAELVEAGQLVPAAVEGWNQPAYLDPQARRPRRVRARALLSPFDSLVWERDRAERLFDFRYRLEIYTPAERRVHGYYVLPFLLGDRLVARVDLKADRQARALRVIAAHPEADLADPGATAAELLAELALMAGWLGLERLDILGGGALGPWLGQGRAPAIMTG